MILATTTGEGTALVAADLEAGTAYYVDADWLPGAGSADVDPLVVDARDADPDLVAGSALVGLAERAAAAAGTAESAVVLGAGTVARHARRVLAGQGIRAPADGRPGAVVDATGDPASVAEALGQVETLGIVVVVGEALGREAFLDLYPDLHVRGLTLVGLERPIPVTVPRTSRLPQMLRDELGHVRLGAVLPRGFGWYRLVPSGRSSASSPGLAWISHDVSRRRVGYELLKRGRTAAAPTRRQDAASAPAISVQGLGKEFHRPRERYTTLKEYVVAPRRVRGHRRLRALDNVSFEVSHGEFFGIIGRNGSGKSTLLRCLSRIYRPDRGEVTVDGRIAPFIELGVGFDGDMAARDNVIVNAVLLGISPREARRRFDDIVAFAELEEFVDLKLKNYSSGMITRLAFAVTVHVDADVLLLDEVLAVGDAGFQQKCYAHFDRLREAGRTVVLVTHDKALVERFCDRTLLLDRGQVAAIGESPAVLRQYSDVIAREARPLSGRDRAPVGARLDGWFENAVGSSVRSVRQGEDCTLCLLVSPQVPVDAPVVTITLENDDGHTVFSTTAGYESLVWLRAAESALIRVRFANVLAPGRYAAQAALSDGNLPVAPSKLVAPLLVLGDPGGPRLGDLSYVLEVVRP